MPYFFKIEVRESSIQGKGVFALEDIPAGALVWAFQTQQSFTEIKGCEPLPNVRVTKAQLEEIEQRGDTECVAGILKHAIYHQNEDVLLLFRDGVQFTNHSTEPNTMSNNHPNVDEVKTFALRDIKAGEELFESYEKYLQQPKWFDDFIDKYYPERSTLQKEIKLELEQKKGTSVAQQ